jgi:hypothetical protein
VGSVISIPQGVVGGHTKSIEEALICASKCFVGYSGVRERIVFSPREARNGTYYQYHISLRGRDVLEMRWGRRSGIHPVRLLRRG